MPVLALPLDTGARARALLHHLLEHGDVVGYDEAGRAVLQLAADDWLLEQLMTFDADAAELEDGADAEPDDHREDDGPPVMALDLHPPRRVRRA